MGYIKEAVGRKTAFNVTLYQTKKTASSASYIVKINSNKNEDDKNYFFGMYDKQINVLHDNGTGYKNIIISSGEDAGVHDPKDRGAELLRWCFPEQSAWKWGKNGKEYMWYLEDDGDKLGLSHYFWTTNGAGDAWGSKKKGWVTGSTIFSKEYTVNIDRGNNKKGYKTVKAKIDGTDGKFGDIEVSLALETTEIAPATLDVFTVEQSDKNSKDRKITVTVNITNPEQYYTFIVRHNGRLLAMKKFESEYCIDIPIDREMYNSMQTFSVTIYCANGEIEVAEKTEEIFIEDAGVGIWYKDEDHPKGAEVEEVWYKDNDGTVRNITEAWVKRSNKVVKTIK